MGERRARQSHAGIPRTPRTARIPEAPREKAPLSFFFFFFIKISRKVSAREREREGGSRAAVKYFVVTELDTEKRTFLFMIEV